MAFRKKSSSTTCCTVRRLFVIAVTIMLCVTVILIWKLYIGKSWSKSKRLLLSEDEQEIIAQQNELQSENIIQEQLNETPGLDIHSQDNTNIVQTIHPKPISPSSATGKLTTTTSPQTMSARKKQSISQLLTLVGNSGNLKEESSTVSNSNHLVGADSTTSDASQLKNIENSFTTPMSASSGVYTSRKPTNLIPTTSKLPYRITPSSTQGQTSSLRFNYPTDLEMSLNYTNPHPFRYLIAEDGFCTHRFKDLFMIVYVHTAPDHFEHRHKIRETWGGKALYAKLRVATIFVLGKTPDKTLSSQISLESQQHHDIVQEDFLDSYRNLTYKGVAALRWITHFCQAPTFILKADDDMLINMYSLVRFLKKEHKQNPKGDQIMGLWYNNNMPIIRDKNSKWYVSEAEYNGTNYLPYCSGSAFILPATVVPKMYNVSFSTKFLWVDDVYVSGLLARAAGITHKSISQFYDLYKKKEELAKSMVFGNKIFGHFVYKPLPGIEWYRKFWADIEYMNQQGF